MYNVRISGSPAVAVFTFTAAGGAVQNRCSTAQFTATSGRTAAGSYPLTYTVNGTQQVSAGTLRVQDPAIQMPVREFKTGWFTRSGDQCRTDPEICLTWQMVTRVQPGDRVVLDEPAGANWVWSCARMEVAGFDLRLTTYANGRRTTVSSRDDPAVRALITGFTCTPDRLRVEVSSSTLAANQSLEFTAFATATTPGGDGGVVYTNTATLDVPAAGGPQQVSGRLESNWVGGLSVGDSISISKSDAAGHAADTQDQAVQLTGASTGLRIVVRNTGQNPLTGITVTDSLVSGTGTVSGLSCDFTAYGGGRGTTWAGPLPSGKVFECTATLSGVTGSHQDRAQVTARGAAAVTATNDFWATGQPAPQMNLRLDKQLVGPAVAVPGQTVEFTLVPRNDGPAPAQAGWSVSEVLPAGLTLVSMTGAGYTCAGVTCTAGAALAGGADGEPVTVRATVDAGATGELRNVAYVSPAAGDVAESVPLGPVPAPGTDTDTTATDNDSSAQLTVTPAAPPVPPAPVPPAPSAPPAPVPTTTQGPSQPQPPAPAPDLADTGSPVAGWQAALALLALMAGAGMVVAARRVNRP